MYGFCSELKKSRRHNFSWGKGKSFVNGMFYRSSSIFREMSQNNRVSDACIKKICYFVKNIFITIVPLACVDWCLYSTAQQVGIVIFAANICAFFTKDTRKERQIAEPDLARCSVFLFLVCLFFTSFF